LLRCHELGDAAGVLGVESEGGAWTHGQGGCVGEGAAREGQARGRVQVQEDAEDVEEPVEGGL
jgi:hypothetical protein